MNLKIYFLRIVCFVVLFSLSFMGQAQNDNVTLIQKDTVSPPKVNVEYTKKGFSFSTSDDKFLMQIESRLQFRFATPGDQNPLTFEEIYTEHQPVFKINRARLKIGGHAFKPWLKYYWEYDVAGGNLLDFRVMVEKWDFFNIKIGQWKTYYSRERVISSGKQQMVDRSIINRPFTIDRQQGIEFYGRLFPETYTDFSYNISVLTGTGRGNTRNDDNNLMYVGRLQYNLFGRELAFTGSDLKHTDKFTGLIAVAGAMNTSRYTRFSTSGGGQLLGFEDGEDGQYLVKQALLETAFMYRGFSWQNEFHIKDVYDHVNHTNTSLKGAYFQGGYFLSNLWSAIPTPLEIAGRYAYYVHDKQFDGNRENEAGLALNWFFKGGHRNKLTAEVTRFDFKEQNENLADGWRFRMQWEISF